MKKGRPYKKARTKALRILARVSRIEKTIETKESSPRSDTNQPLPHNNVYVCKLANGAGTGTPLNPFQIGAAAGDPMAGTGNRIGDQITVKGVAVKAFFENALGRAKVYYRMMLIRAAKGDTIDRSTLFKGDSTNKMLDQINTERFAVVAQKIFNISCSNFAPGTVGGTGIPLTATVAGIGSKIVTMWIPGKKFGRNGNVKWENADNNQVKFYDYRLVLVAYDWFGTPQDVNDVGRINDLFFKVYFKDA